MRFKRFAIMLTLLAGLIIPAFTFGQSITLQRLRSGLSSPIFVTHAPGDPDRLYILQRTGLIRIMDVNNPSAPLRSFMTVPNVDTFFEGGLLGLAFHPDFQNNRQFYVNFTTSTGGGFRTRISRFTATNSDSASSSTQQIVLEINQPQGNHNGGWIGFSPIDNYLYIATGDGGGANDTSNNSQDITNKLLGKMLRIDIDGDDFPSDSNRNYAIPSDNPFVGITGDDEIFLYGLRNPFRCSFDRANGDLYIGDVGQGAREEISYYPASGLANRNMGWRLREGTIPGVGGTIPSDNVNPIYDYTRFGDFGGNSVTGGMVYRGSVEGLQGMYMFADFGSDNFWGFRFDCSPAAEFDGDNHSPVIYWNNSLTVDAGFLGSIVAFGEDLAGDMYIVDFGGEIFKIVDGEVAFLGDMNLDNRINLLDVSGFVSALSSGTYSYEADTNQDGKINLLDVGPFVDILSDL